MTEALAFQVKGVCCNFYACTFMLQSVSACFEEHVGDNYLGAVSVADRFIGQSVETDDPFPV